MLDWTNEAGTTGVYRLRVGPIGARDAEVDVRTRASRANDGGSDGH